MSYLIAAMSKLTGESINGLTEAGECSRGLTANQNSLTVWLDNFFLKADLGPRHLGSIWIEDNSDSMQRSAVIAFGWCYKIGAGRHHLNSEDSAEVLERFRRNQNPDLDALSGAYCLVIFDHAAHSAWICTDKWAQHGFYYGGNKNYIIASSRAAVIADYYHSPIDGISYLCQVRGNAIPPGRSMYSGVWRATCGKAIHFDLESNTAKVVQIQPVYQPPNRLSLAEATDRFVQVISRVVPLAAGEPNTCVALSGGNDCRMTAAVLASYGRGEIAKRVTFRVTGAPEHPDVITASKIAELMGWKLVRNDRNMPFTNSEGNWERAAVLSDGKMLLPTVLHRLAEEESVPWHNTTNIVDSIAGELFRYFIFKHELYHLGLKQKIDYRAWLIHRLHAVMEVDTQRISNGQLTIPEHNEAQLEPYSELEKSMPPAHIYHRLDRFYFFKLMHMTWFWTLSDLCNTITPYFTSEITNVSLSIPWYHKMRRRIITDGIERLAPELAKIPSDRGAPMNSLHLNNIDHYARWYISDLSSAYRRHFGKKKFIFLNPATFVIDPQWLDLLFNSQFTNNLYPVGSLLDNARKKQGIGLTRSEYFELNSLFLLDRLNKHYVHLQPRLDFEAPSSPIAATEFSL